MKTEFYDAKCLLDAVRKDERRSRHILAASGKLLESGEIRDLQNLYVMSRDGEPIRIGTLNSDPKKQTEDYTVKAQLDHGKVDEMGELTPTVEKQIGSCRVWLDADGQLHAQMYFADNDALADHAWAISEDASYSIGVDWYPEGYYGAGNDIEEPIGILREISMVMTGNDPRAKTIDTKTAKAQGSADGDNNNNAKTEEAQGSETETGTNEDGEKEMSEIKDNLTPDENKAIKAKLVDELASKIDEVVDDFSTEAPESETQPTAVDAKAEETETKDALRSPVVVVRDRIVKQETTADAGSWVKSNAGKRALFDTLKQTGGKFDAKFDQLWTAEARKHSVDGITGLADPLNIANIFTEMMEKSDGIISYFTHINSKGLRNNALAGATDAGARAQGFKKGDTKVDESLANTIRVVYTKMVYKKLSLDAKELYENPELIEFRARELVDRIIMEIEMAAIKGDGRSAGTPDLRMFDSETGEGFYSIAADAASNSGYGSLVATTYQMTAGDNLYDGIVGSRQYIRTEGDQILVVKPSVLAQAFQAKVGNRYLIEPGATAEDIFRVARVFSPMWMEDDSVNDAYLIVKGAYTTVGKNTIDVHPFFDVSNNTNVLLDETPRGGSLTKYKSAVAIKGAGASA